MTITSDWLRHAAWIAVMGLSTVARFSVYADLDIEHYDPHVGAERVFHFSLGEISSAVWLDHLPDMGGPGLLAVPDSPGGPGNPGGHLTPHALIHNLSSGEESGIRFAAPYRNEDVESMTYDPDTDRIIILNSGSSRQDRRKVRCYIVDIQKIQTAEPVPCMESIILLPEEARQRGLFEDIEAVVLHGQHLFLIEKRLTGNAPHVARVALDDVYQGRAPAEMAGRLHWVDHDEWPLFDWVTDATILQHAGHAWLYVLGYSGVYRGVLPLSDDTLDTDGFQRIVGFRQPFEPVQTRLAETLVVVGWDEGYVIKEHGYNARRELINSPAFYFTDKGFSRFIPRQ